MDLSPDSVRTFFTKGQVRRMYAMLSQDGPRSGLWKSKTACSTPRTEGIGERTDGSPEQISTSEAVVQVFPNPADGMVRIAAKSARPLSLHIFNETGARIYTQQALPESLTLDCRQWPNGIYLFAFYTKDKVLARKTVSVNHP